MTKQKNFDDYEPITDEQGRLKNIPPGSFIDCDKLSKEILEEAEVTEQSIEEPNKKAKPYFAEDLIAQYEFFRKNIYEPKKIFYPCCNVDASPIRGFPNSKVVLMDEIDFSETMRKKGITQFIHGDVLEHTPKTPYDLVIILNPSLKSKDLTKHLVNGGYALVNNWHNNASQLIKNKQFEGIGTILQDKNKGIYLAEKDFSMLKPNQFATYFYVFKKQEKK